MYKKEIVYVKFPKTGLGNMLFVWARAVVFARINNLELTTSFWCGLHLGSIKRWEQKKRFYWRYFKESSIYSQLLAEYYLRKVNIYREPLIEKKTPTHLNNKNIYIFSQLPTENDYFISIRCHKHIVINELYKLLHPTKRKILEKLDIPNIGIHVRRGDFILGSTVTPLLFFSEAINIIRTYMGAILPVTIFSDGTYDELSSLLLLPATKLAGSHADILDILLLSKSNFIITSATSTFSYWAAFLSEAFVIRPYNDWHPNLNNENSDFGYKEFKWNYNDENSTILLKNKLLAFKLRP